MLTGKVASADFGDYRVSLIVVSVTGDNRDGIAIFDVARGLTGIVPCGFRYVASANDVTVSDCNASCSAELYSCKSVDVSSADCEVSILGVIDSRRILT